MGLMDWMTCDDSSCDKDIVGDGRLCPKHKAKAGKRVALELVRNDDGAIVEIAQIDESTIFNRADAKGYVQVINGKPVIFLKENEILLIE